MNVNLDALAAFEAVARHGSFTRAARELAVTQSAVSHRVRGLEQQLGVTLLVRSTREVTPTEAGATLAEGVRRGLTAIRDTLQRIEERREGESLAVSCSPSFAIRWLVRHLYRYREKQPATRVHIAAADELVSPGVAGIDVCIRFGAGRYPGLSVTRLSTEEVFPVASPSLIAHTPLRSESQLADHQLLHHDVMRDHPEHVSWARWLSPRARRRVDAEAGQRFSHAHMALEAALAGQGVALGRTTLVADDLREGRLVAPLRRRVPSGLAYWFLSTRAGADEPRISAFLDWLRRALAGRG